MRWPWSIACALLNIAGVKVVSLTSLWLFVALSAPFVAIVVLAPFKLGALANAVTKPTTSTVDILGGLLICMWNYMGWDNASTIATEVERPQRTYPRAMLVAVCIVAASYVLPFAAMWMTGLKPTAWETGSWADIAGLIGGPLLRIGVVLGGMISAFGMFNALVMSYSRLPLAMAQDGMLPGVFGKLQKKSRAPWVAIIALAIGWGMCLGLGFARLVTIDILLYGASLLLEFMALAVLRFREPELGASVPRAGRPVRSDRHRHSAHAAARLFGGPQRARTDLEYEFVRLRDDPDRGGLRRLLHQSRAEASWLGSAKEEAANRLLTGLEHRSSDEKDRENSRSFLLQLSAPTFLRLRTTRPSPCCRADSLPCHARPARRQPAGAQSGRYSPANR